MDTSKASLYFSLPYKFEFIDKALDHIWHFNIFPQMRTPVWKIKYSLINVRNIKEIRKDFLTDKASAYQESTLVGISVKLNDGDLRNFCFLCIDVVGHSVLSEKHNQFDVHCVLDEIHELTRKVTEENSGFEIVWAGDGGCFAFLRDKGSENIFDKTIEASFRILSELAEYNADKSPLDGDISVRIGIDYGEGTYKNNHGDIHCDFLNSAKHLEEDSEPNKILISERIYRDISGKLKAMFEESDKSTSDCMMYISRKADE